MEQEVPDWCRAPTLQSHWSAQSHDPPSTPSLCCRISTSSVLLPGSPVSSCYLFSTPFWSFLRSEKVIARMRDAEPSCCCALPRGRTSLATSLPSPCLAPLPEPLHRRAGSLSLLNLPSFPQLPTAERTTFSRACLPECRAAAWPHLAAGGT